MWLLKHSAQKAIPIKVSDASVTEGNAQIFGHYSVVNVKAQFYGEFLFGPWCAIKHPAHSTCPPTFRLPLSRKPSEFLSSLVNTYHSFLIIFSQEEKLEQESRMKLEINNERLSQIQAERYTLCHNIFQHDN